MVDKKRLKIGILFNFNPVWMGGIIYIQNLIRILNFLDDNEKPEIILFYRPDLRKLVDPIKYPYLKTIEWDFPPIIKGNILSWLKRKNVFVDKILKQYNELDGLFPLQDYPVKTKNKAKLVCWYADLQHKYYSEFFSKLNVFERNIRIRFILKNAEDLIVSSHAVADDFEKFFKMPKYLKLHIFHFASIIEDFSGLDIIKLRKKYNLPEKYFMVSNQFHKHKNHEVLLEVLIRLKERGINVHIAMSGPFRDAPPTTYRQKLSAIIDKSNLHSNISLLGMVSRDEQLLLMKHSQAILQPSLFEGWSTVIEDAISMQVPVVASSLPVNIEQLRDKGTFFDPHDEKKLANILYNYPLRDINDVFYEKYEDRVKNAAQVFVDVFKS